MKAGSLTDNIHTEHLLLLYESSALPVVERDATVQPVFSHGFVSKQLVVILAYSGRAPHVHPLLLFTRSLQRALSVSLDVPFRLDTPPALCATMKTQQPLARRLLRTELHSSHAPPTRFLSLLLFMHESLSFFLLTNVRASQKCLHLLSSIIHSISSTSYQNISALGHNPFASLVDDSHLVPHMPPFH